MGEGGGRHHVRRRTSHTSARVGQIRKLLMAERSREIQEHDGVVCMAVELPEIGRSDFEKNKSNNFKNRVDLGQRS
jgi:hypothetical protein